MGLDLAELAIDMEEAFDIRMSDAEAQEGRTGAEYAQLMLRLVARQRGVCLDAGEVRATVARLIATRAGIAADEVDMNADLLTYFAHG
jgi:hypothetical protein